MRKAALEAAFLRTTAGCRAALDPSSVERAAREAGTVQIGVTALLTDRTMGPARFAAEVEARGFASLYLPEHTHLPIAEAEPPATVTGVDPEAYARTLDPLVAPRSLGPVNG